MARPIWRGHLRLALVSCPVALYNARHDRAGLRFNLINPDTGNRIRMITQDAETGQDLERRNLVKGYEFRKNEYLLLSDDDFDSVKAPYGPLTPKRGLFPKCFRPFVTS
jgi:DNA end-binding protein Ku